MTGVDFTDVRFGAFSELDEAALEVALEVARDHAVKARDALEGADGLQSDVSRTLGRLVDGLVHRER